MQGLAGAASAVAVTGSRGRDIIVDRTDLEFTNGGPTALPRALRQARHSGGDLVLAAPQQQVVRVRARTGLAGIRSVLHGVKPPAASGGRRCQCGNGGLRYALAALGEAVRNASPRRGL